MEPHTLSLTALGDQAILIALPDESTAVRLAAAIRSAAPPWLHDVVPAYARVGVFFDADLCTVSGVMEWVRSLQLDTAEQAAPGRLHLIPVCYEFAPDLPRVAEFTHLRESDVIQLHSSLEYTIHAIGFVPGFPYLGYLPKELEGVPRLASPRLRVEPGSIGMTGRQTGLYPLPRPGGWNLIGRTPVVVVDVAAGFFPLRVGDRVRFQRIDESEYRRLDGERLSVQ